MALVYPRNVSTMSQSQRKYRLDPVVLNHMFGNQAGFNGCSGSIVRIRVKNFMTYDEVELRAGPNVNLILGPNGTGKSTIVCAICLGLAGKPNILGRARTLKEYIRHGSHNASIEIELYNPGGRNYVVRREIKNTSGRDPSVKKGRAPKQDTDEYTKKGVTSNWWLNGSPCNISAVEKLMKSLNIQLDNLCQFLPQDRVQEFSRMDSYTLLQSTEKAVGNDTLADKHEKLIQMSQEVNASEHFLGTLCERLRVDCQYNQRVENEVQTFQQRERVKARIAELTGMRLWVVYKNAIDVFSDFTKELNKIKSDKSAEEKRIAPLKKIVELMESKSVKFRQDMSKVRTLTVSQMNGLRRKYEDELDVMETQISQVLNKVKIAEKNEEDRKRRYVNCINKKEALEAELAQLQSREGDVNDANIRSRMKVLEAQKQKLTEKAYDLLGQNEIDQRECFHLRQRMSVYEKDLRSLDDWRVGRLKFLERVDPGTYAVVQHLQIPENQTRFKGVIHEPMILHVHVNDLYYGRIAENRIGLQTLTAFLCEEAEDVKKFATVVKELGKRASAIHHEVRPNMKKPAPLYGQEFMKKYHIKKFLVDLIEGPEYYLTYIWSHTRPQEIPIGCDATDKVYSELINNSKIRTLYTDNYVYHVKSSRYVQGELIPTFSAIGAARVFTDNIVTVEKDSIQATLDECRKSEERLQQEIRKRDPSIQRFEQERLQVENEIKEFQSKVELRKQLEHKIAATKNNADMLSRDQIDLVAEQNKADNSIRSHRKQFVNQVVSVTNKMTVVSKEATMLSIYKKQLGMLQEHIVAKSTKMEDAQTSITHYNTRITELKEQVKTAAAHAEKSKKEAVGRSQLSEPPKDVLDGKLKEDELDQEIHKTSVQLGFLAVTDPNIIREYQDRTKLIEENTAQKKEKEKKLADLKEQIQTLREEWLTPLRNLIAKIDRNFGNFFVNMGLAGEVLLDIPDEKDYSKYGIKIQVKFRADEALAELSGYKQSGGERAITTALYVLALQELTTVPFRVVDEINQGMDAKNEARFFNLLCTLAKGEDTPQYFLLTPKMLPPVLYPDNVDFHFILSGPHVDVPVNVNTPTSSIPCLYNDTPGVQTQSSKRGSGIGIGSGSGSGSGSGKGNKKGGKYIQNDVSDDDDEGDSGSESGSSNSSSENSDDSSASESASE